MGGAAAGICHAEWRYELIFSIDCVFPKVVQHVPIRLSMSTSPINNFSSSYVQSILNTTLQNAGVTSQNSSSLNGVDSSSYSDNGQISPFAQVLSTLQQLQQTNPSQYQTITQQIATNLQTAAQTATTDGNTGAASELTQLSNDFTTASQNGQLPNIQDLAQAIGGSGGHHHHHHSHGASSSGSADSDSGSSSSGSSSSGSTNGSQSLSQLLASFQSNSAQNGSLNPLNIILNTLNNAGVLGANAE